jgi:hypothetical protein
MIRGNRSLRPNESKYLYLHGCSPSRSSRDNSDATGNIRMFRPHCICAIPKESTFDLSIARYHHPLKLDEKCEITVHILHIYPLVAGTTNGRATLLPVASTEYCALPITTVVLLEYWTTTCRSTAVVGSSTFQLPTPYYWELLSVHKSIDSLLLRVVESIV